MFARLTGRSATVLVVTTAGAVGVCVHATVVASQDRQQTFRSAVALVPLDVRAIDASGNPVTDLRLDEFKVLQDGVPQVIEHFLRRDFLSHSQAAAPIGTEPSQEPTYRTFLLLLGRGRLQEPAMGIDAAVALLRDGLQPTDRVSLMAYGRATDFLTDREPLVRLLRRYEARHTEIEARLDHWFSGLQAVFGSRELPAGSRTKIDELFKSPHLPRVREMPVFGLPGDGQFEEDRLFITAAFDRSDGSLRSQSIPNHEGRDDLEKLHAALSYLRYQPGEKHLVFLTEEGLQVAGRHVDLLASMAADARVTVSTIRTGGLSTSWSSTGEYRGPPVSQFFSLRDAASLATETGGMSFAHRYASDAFGALDKATSFSYLLGYYPSLRDRSGDFRNIEISVTRANVRLFYRRGYYDKDEPAHGDRRAAVSRARVLAAGLVTRPIADLPLKLSVSPLLRNGRRWQVQVQVRVPTEAVEFNDVEGRKVAELSVAVFVGTNSNQTIGELWRTVDLKLKPDTYARYERDGLSFTAAVDLSTPGRYVKAVVYDYLGDRLGTAITRVR